VNYYVYHNGGHIRSFRTEQEAIAYVKRHIEQWREAGARGHGEYKVCYNGSTSATLVHWPAETFAAKAERVAKWQALEPASVIRFNGGAR
jgi:hypothetical protein